VPDVFRAERSVSRSRRERRFWGVTQTSNRLVFSGVLSNAVASGDDGSSTVMFPPPMPAVTALLAVKVRT
jgi:hypothetical protein